MNNMLSFALKTAIAGLILAILGGLFGSVDFPTVLLRMIVSFILAGGAGAGLYTVVQKFLPELLAMNGSSNQDNPLDAGLGDEISSQQGSNVNIIIDDDSADGPADQAQALRGEMSQAPAGAAAAGDGGDMPLVEERIESADDSSEPVNLFVDDDNEIIEEVHEDGRPRGKNQASAVTGGDELNSVANLPDLSGFSDSFTDGSFDDEESPEGESLSDNDYGSDLSDMGTSGLGNSGSSPDSDGDPKVLAQAIRTLMHKE